jgi:hypothetical protein
MMSSLREQSGLGSGALLAVVAVAGLGCVMGPAIAAGVRPMASPLFPMLRASVEGLTWASAALLCVLGLAAGWATELAWARIGAASVVLLPLAALAEIVADGTSHNLIPFELAMYAMLAVPAAIGALAGRGLRRMTVSRAAPSRGPTG